MRMDVTVPKHTFNNLIWLWISTIFLVSPFNFLNNWVKCTLTDSRLHTEDTLKICLNIFCIFILTLTLLDLTKSYKNYLQNTQHVVLRNRPTLPIGTERLACLNSPRGLQLVTLAWHAAGPGFEPRARRARCARFFSPPSLPSSFGR